MPQRTGGVGGAQNNQSPQYGFSDSDIKELGYDLGVDARVLKARLAQNFKSS